ELLRIPNRPDLYPRGILLRLPDSTLDEPQVSKPLSDSDVVVNTDGSREFTLGPFDSPAGSRVRVWTCTVTRDGIPSTLGGPCSLILPLPPLPRPTLTAVSMPGSVRFTWSWPDARRYDTALHRSTDGNEWKRISPVITASNDPGTYHFALKGANVTGSF